MPQGEGLYNLERIQHPIFIQFTLDYNEVKLKRKPKKKLLNGGKMAFIYSLLLEL